MRTTRDINALVACELSGTVRNALRALGVNAWSNDLQPARDGSRYHLRGDAREILRRGLVPESSTRWHLLIAHPPCTYLCNSGVGRLMHTPPNPSPGVPYGEARWQAMRDAAQLFADLLGADVPHAALENPIMHGHARAAIAAALNRPWHDPITRYTQTIQPYQFGDDASKRTALWLRGLPALEIPPGDQWHPARLICDHCKHVRIDSAIHAGERCTTCGIGTRRARWGNQTDSGQNALTPSDKRAEIRSDTYPGIAAAMVDQWIRAILAGR